AQAERRNQELLEKQARIGSELVEAKSQAESEEARRRAAEMQAEVLRNEATRSPGDGIEDIDGSTVDLEDLRDRVGPGARVVKNANGGATIVLASDITFRAGRADLNRNAESTLGRVVRALQETPGIARVRIEGHTDSDPIKKSGWSSNEELSLERAKRVRMYLVSKGLIEDNLSVAGHGSSRPIAPNNDANGKAKNRRVEIVVETDK
ncbi:MAG: OmpA family protein, partial [Planctomycetota bacterium]|nr:OmpA family protein [Planctomycetota bacterium]